MHKSALFIVLLSCLTATTLTNPIREDVRPTVGTTTATAKLASKNNTHLHQHQERFPLLWVEIALAVAFSIGAASFAITMSVPHLLENQDIKRDLNVYDYGSSNLRQKTSQYNYESPQTNVLEAILIVSMRGNNVQAKSESSNTSGELPGGERLLLVRWKMI